MDALSNNNQMFEFKTLAEAEKSGIALYKMFGIIKDYKDFNALAWIWKSADGQSFLIDFTDTIDSYSIIPEDYEVMRYLLIGKDGKLFWSTKTLRKHEEGW